jgi:ABC-2 type transport system permease protein
MKARRILLLMRKSLSPKNPYVAFAFIAPFIYAALFQFIFGLWQDKPGIAVYEGGDAAVTRQLEDTQAVSVSVAGSPDDLLKLVEEQKVDVGIVVTREAKESLAAGDRASLEIFIGGESLDKNRAIALAAIAGAIRAETPGAPQVSFELVELGDEKALSLMEMLLPFFVIVIILLGAYMLPASFVVAEKEKKTLTALLVTPVTLAEILLAFGAVGIFISLAMGMIVLLLTVGITQPVLLLIIFALGSILGAEWGLMLGLFSRDQASLIAYIKGLNIFIVAPALFVIFPSWPQWIARIFPTYYIANPIFRISIYGDAWSEIGWQVLALAGFAALFAAPLAAFTLRSAVSAKSRLLTS